MNTFSIPQNKTRKSQRVVILSQFQNDNIQDIDIIASQESWRKTQDQTRYHH